MAGAGVASLGLRWIAVSAVVLAGVCDGDRLDGLRDAAVALEFKLGAGLCIHVSPVM